MEIVQVPITLPKGWRATSDSRGVVIDSFDEDGRMQGSVTVSEQVRGFALGIQSVHASSVSTKYAGRGWREKLYADAVAALQAVWDRQAARMN